MRHVISAIRFAPGAEAGACECTCGAEMPSTDFREHRRTVNAPGRPNGADYASGRVKPGSLDGLARRTPGQTAFGRFPVR